MNPLIPGLKLVLLLPFSAILFFCLTCKKTDKQAKQESEPHSAVAHEEISASSDRFYSIWKKPLERRLDKLPTSAQVKPERMPYSGGAYAEIQGGTNVSGALTRYDKAFGTAAAAWEAKNHSRVRKTSDDDWHGHCNAFSAAAQRHKEPFKSAKDVASGVVFTAADVKALLAEVYMSTKAIFLSGMRCEREQKNITVTPYTRPDPEKMGTCEDVNPGNLHLILTNWIGLMKHTVIMDYTIERQIWNYPTYKFISTLRNISKQEALRIIGDSTSNEYRYNESAKKWSEVRLTVTHAEILESEQVGYRSPGKTLEMHYILELDEGGNIIGGEWASDNQKQHPDFVWVSLEPFPGTGDKRMANPHVDAKKVFELWKLSINDPNPEWDIMEPVWQTSWGKFADFTVELDGRQTGAVFGGKKTNLKVVTTTTKLVNETFDISLNGEAIKTGAKFAGKEFTMDFIPTPGINDLQIRLLQANETQNLRFHVIR